MPITPSSLGFRWERAKKNRRVWVLPANLSLFLFLVVLPSLTVLKRNPNVGRREEGGRRGRREETVLWYLHLSEPDQFASLFREEQGKPHSGVLWALVGFSTIAA